MWIYFKCPTCALTSYSAKYVMKGGRRIFQCEKCDSWAVLRCTPLRAISGGFAGGAFAVAVAAGIELLLDPSARYPQIFDAAPWITPFWLVVIFSIVVYAVLPLILRISCRWTSNAPP